MADPPGRPQPELTAAEGPWRGPTCACRGARIECLPSAHVCALFLEGHRPARTPFGVVRTVTPLVDLWVEERRLPGQTRAVPKADG